MQISEKEFQRRRKAIAHIVHDFAMLEAAGMKTVENLEYPFNHFAERTFLVECRKFSDFFKNSTSRRGKNDAVAMHFTTRKLKLRLPTWKDWRDHINEHLMHLSYARVDNEVPWDGHDVHPKLLREFREAWQRFRDALAPRFAPELDAQLAARGMS
jgi:hypothetical protein